MIYKKYIVFVAIASIIFMIGANSVLAGNAVIWDSMVKETKGKLYYEFKDSLAWSNKANWHQVPYGTIGYTFVGDPILDNGNFWLHLQSSYMNSPMLYGNLNGEAGEGSELYGGVWYESDTSDCYWSDGKEHCGYENIYPNNIQIIKNQPDEIIIQADMNVYFKGKNIAQYRVKANTGWFEETPKTKGNYNFGVHTGPHKFGISPPPNEANNDFVIDKDYVGGPGIPNKLYPVPTNNKFALYQIFSDYSDFYTIMVIPKDMPSSKLEMQVFYEATSPTPPETRGYTALEQITARDTEQNIANNAVYIGVVNQKNVFRHETSNYAISAGGSYTAYFKPAIAGKWRISGRVNGIYYTQMRDVQAGGDLAFTSPVAGTLQAVVMYLYDRTSSTPSFVNTPMDIYRDINNIGPTPIINNIGPTPIPAIAQQGIINNPGFESGTISWLVDPPASVAFSTASPGYEGNYAANLALSSGTGVQLYQKDIILEPNTRYRLSFAAKSSTGLDLTVYLHKHGSPYTNYGLSYNADLGTNWQIFATEFTTSSFTGTVNDGRLRFWIAPFGAAGDIYNIDNVRLETI
jgi:hypothetical protein